MSALIFAMVFCHLFLKKFSMKALLILGGVLFLFGLIETYHGLITNEILLQSVNTYFLLMFTTRNGLFFGVLFVALGMALADQNRVEAIRHPFAKAAAAFGLLVVEAFTVRHFHWALDYNMYLMTVPLSCTGSRGCCGQGWIGNWTSKPCASRAPSSISVTRCFWNWAKSCWVRCI